LFYVPPGVLHAVGEGVFLVELQEPEDLSILLEWRGFELDGERDGHLGLGFDLAPEAVECRSRSGEEIRQLVRPAGW
jgi:mannose-6-phosphate isomerase